MDSATQILEIAERKMRKDGYNAVSFRDIAAEMGIKSASLHYHFPKKEDLGIALVKNYSEKFYGRLAGILGDETRPKEMIAAFVDNFRFALQDQELICLCAVLGAEAPSLPRTVAGQVKTFFESLIDWLSLRYEALGINAPDIQAKTSVALLEGAMIVSSVNDDLSIFDAAAKTVLDKRPE